MAPPNEVRLDVNYDGLDDTLVFSEAAVEANIPELVSECHINGIDNAACREFMTAQAINTTWHEMVEEVRFHPGTADLSYNGGVWGKTYTLQESTDRFYFMPGGTRLRLLFYTFDNMSVTEQAQFIWKLMTALREKDTQAIGELIDKLVSDTPSVSLHPWQRQALIDAVIKHADRLLHFADRFFSSTEADVTTKADEIHQAERKVYHDFRSNSGSGGSLAFKDFYWREVYDDPEWASFRAEALVDIHRGLAEFRNSQMYAIEAHLASVVLIGDADVAATPALTLEVGRNYTLMWNDNDFMAPFYKKRVCPDSESSPEGDAPNPGVVCEGGKIYVQSARLVDIISTRLSYRHSQPKLYYGFELGDTNRKVYFESEHISTETVKASD